MRKLFIDKIEGQTTVLSGDEHWHLSRVLRARVGDSVVVCDCNGKNYDCVIERISGENTYLRVMQAGAEDCEPTIDCTLFFGILKGSGNDSTVRHGVELGVNRFIPLLTRYSVAQDIRSERLNNIALQASKQCGRSKVPTVDSPISFSDLAGLVDSFDLVVFLYERAKSSLSEYLSAALGSRGCSVAIIVGAEGGFSENEAELLQSRGVVPLSMGKRILKADTAAIAAVCAVMYQAKELT